MALTDFIHSDRLDLADRTIHFILFSSFELWRLTCGVFFLGVLFSIWLTELNQSLSLKTDFLRFICQESESHWTRNRQFFCYYKDNFKFCCWCSINLHMFAMLLCTIHIFVEFIAALRFIVAIWFELVLKTFLKVGQFYFSFTQRTFVCSESTTDTVEQGVKIVQSQQ